MRPAAMAVPEAEGAILDAQVGATADVQADRKPHRAEQPENGMAGRGAAGVEPRQFFRDHLPKRCFWQYEVQSAKRHRVGPMHLHQTMAETFFRVLGGADLHRPAAGLDRDPRVLWTQPDGFPQFVAP